MNQDFIDKAIKIFNVKTEKEAVNQALKIVTDENYIINTHKEIGGLGNIEKIFK